VVLEIFDFGTGPYGPNLPPITPEVVFKAGSLFDYRSPEHPPCVRMTFTREL
jgi:hypothetical protein